MAWIPCKDCNKQYWQPEPMGEWKLCVFCKEKRFGIPTVPDDPEDIEDEDRPEITFVDKKINKKKK